MYGCVIKKLYVFLGINENKKIQKKVVQTIL